MKTISRFFLLFLSACSLLACTNANQKMAEDYIAAHLLCPSTMKVVSVTDSIIPSETYTDTTYHIQKVYGEINTNPNRYTEYARIDSVVLDSFHVIQKITPQIIAYHIIFDSQNEYGAMVRDEADVMVFDSIACNYYEMGEIIGTRPWKVLESGECVPICAMPTKQSYLSEGEWMQLDESIGL